MADDTLRLQFEQSIVPLVLEKLQQIAVRDLGFVVTFDWPDVSKPVITVTPERTLSFKERRALNQWAEKKLGGALPGFGTIWDRILEDDTVG